ncbi:MAG: ribose-5-phosphate isomerase RpiA [Niabella sp.]
MKTEKELAALAAVKFVKDGMVIGLGTGSTAYFAIKAVGAMVQNGLQIKAVPTSEATRQMAETLQIPLIDINEISAIDVTIDGADEFTENFELIKGGGGALLREKIVASLTNQQIIIADSSKKVEKLGKFKLPIEVIPFAYNYVLTQIDVFGGKGAIRMKGGERYITDQGNYIIDADFGLIDNPATLDKQLKQVTGIVEHGLFINLTHKIIMGTGGTTVEYHR